MAVVVTYTYPVSGTTPPTVAQALAVNMVIAQVSVGDADLTALFTHNFQASLADGTNLFPIPIMYPSSPGTAIPSIAAALTNSVLMTISKLSAAGSGGTWTVVVMRPQSMTR